jgi:hypothetical protein
LSLAEKGILEIEQITRDLRDVQNLDQINGMQLAV